MEREGPGTPQTQNTLTTYFAYDWGNRLTSYRVKDYDAGQSDWQWSVNQLKLHA